MNQGIIKRYTRVISFSAQSIAQFLALAYLLYWRNTVICSHSSNRICSQQEILARNVWWDSQNSWRQKQIVTFEVELSWWGISKLCMTRCQAIRLRNRFFWKHFVLEHSANTHWAVIKTTHSFIWIIFNEYTLMKRTKKTENKYIDSMLHPTMILYMMI